MIWAHRVTSRLGATLILIAAAIAAVAAFALSPEQPAAEPTDGLPAGKQSTRVTELADQFASGRAAAAIVVFERESGPLTEADLATVTATRDELGQGAELPPPIPSDDGQAVLLVVPTTGDDEAQAQAVDDIRANLDVPDGLTAYVTGGPAFGRDIAAAFEGADVRLLLATAGVVALLLLITYRSPFLWIVPLAVVGVGDQIVAKILPWVARLVGERTDASVAGIVSVLVFGAGTDYALLLVSRYREELRRQENRRDAMATALRGVAPAIVASAGTVILAVLTLLAAVVTSNRTLGISAAIGVAVALVFGLLVLPAALVSLPRGIFWPFVPRAGDEPKTQGLWHRVAQLVARRPRAVLAVAVLFLAALSAGLVRTELGLSQTEQFRTEVESVTGQEALARHFPAGLGQPLTVIVPAAGTEQATTTIADVDGVAAVGRPERSDDGTLTKLTVDLENVAGSPEADRTVQAIRAAAPDALVGGDPAANLDRRDANVRDDLLIVPLVLAVVLLVLVALLRSVLAPVLLLVTVVVSYAASLGAATLVLRYGLGLPALDESVPLLSFLFLVALGVDYNIFLVTRAREETEELGDTKKAFQRALVATGGVITSAGILLAAVFAVLGVLPVIVLTQIGVIVGIGVLLDTLLVRTVVVPAIAILLGDRFWWPSKTRPPRTPGQPGQQRQPDGPDVTAPARPARTGT